MSLSPLWVSDFERLLGDVATAAGRIRMERSAAGYDEFCKSPQVRDFWEFANSSWPEVHIKYEGP